MNDLGGDPVSAGGVSWKRPAARWSEITAQASPMPGRPRGDLRRTSREESGASSTGLVIY